MQYNIITVSKLSKSYRISLNSTFQALQDASFTVQKGQIVSFIGANGAGKSTLLKVLVGINKPTSGYVKILNHSNDSLYAKNKIAFMPENPQFFSELNALTTLTLLARFYENGVKDVGEILRSVGLYEDRQKPIGTFSKGMKQRLGFAQCLVGNPAIIFLDEPLDGLDPIGRKELKEHFLKLKEQGVTIVLCSHILSDIDEISDQIGIIHAGRLLSLTTPKEFKQHQSLETAFVNHIKNFK